MPDVTLDRPLPHNVEAERSVLGAVLLDNAAFIAFDAISPEDFYGLAHRCIAGKMVEMRAAGKVVDILTLDDELTRAGKLEAVGGTAYIAALGDGVPRISHVQHYARIVKADALLRGLINTCHDAMTRAFELEGQPQEIVDHAVRSIARLVQDGVPQEQEGMSYRKAADRLLSSFEKRDGVRIFTDIETLDEQTGGFRAGELILFTAETGTGKTLLAQQVRRRACRDGLHGLFASAEMRAEHLVARELATEADIPHWKMRQPESINLVERGALMVAASQECSRCRILDGELSVTRIRLAARQMKTGSGIALVVIDYDELVQAEGRDEFERQTNLVRDAKLLAVELACPVILISQLRKLLQGEDRRRPTLQRLYGSSSKAKHPQLVLYVDRPYVQDLVSDETEARICILKNRDGRLGALDVVFNVRTLRFQSPIQQAPVDAGPRDRQLPPKDRE